MRAAQSKRVVQKRGKRGEVKGWTQGSANRNEWFLKSVIPEALEGLKGYALTLTLRYRPSGPEVLAKMVHTFFHMLGCEHFHWVIEWQPRTGHPDGPCPHLHCIVYFKEPPVYVPKKKRLSFRAYGVQALLIRWLRVQKGHGALITAQYGSEVYGFAGWAGYMAKHASRGVKHYQRSAQLPKGWEKPGRVWGKSNNWPVRSDEYVLSDKLFFRVRRFVNRFMLARTRREILEKEKRLGELFGLVKEQEAKNLAKLKRRFRFLKQQLRRRDRVNGQLVPVAEWVPDYEIERWISRNTVPFDYVDEVGEIFERHRAPDEQEDQTEWRTGYVVSDWELQRSLEGVEL